jgi:hypothetical protein
MLELADRFGCPRKPRLFACSRVTVVSACRDGGY